MLRGRRHGCVDQRIGTVHQDAGGLAGDAVTLDVAVARVQRIRIDASQFQRAGVDHHAAPGAVEDGHRTIRQDAVQPVSVRHQSGLLEGVAHEVLAVDPAIAGVGGGIVEDGLPDLLRRRVLHAHFQVARVARSQLQVRVRVHVVQARHGEAPFQVQHAGTRTDQAVHFPTGTDCNEAPSANGHGFGPGVGGIHGVDTAVSQHEVGGAGRPRQVRRTEVGVFIHGSEVRIGNLVMVLGPRCLATPRPPVSQRSGGPAAPGSAAKPGPAARRSSAGHAASSRCRHESAEWPLR
ncbi:hypothetical protein D9M71_238500 [compost metagenome]